MDRQRGRVVRGLDLGPRGGAGIVVGPKSNRRGAPPKTKRRRRRRSFHRAGQRGEGRRRARAERPYGGRHPRRRARPRAAQGREPGLNLAPGVAGSSRGCLLGEASRRGPPTTTGRIRVGDRRGRPRRHLRSGVATVRIVTVRVRARVDDGSCHRPEARGGGPRARGNVGRVARRDRARAGGLLAKRRDDVSYSTSAPTRLGDVGTRHGLGQGARAGRRWVDRGGGGGGPSGRRRGVGRRDVRPGSVGERRRATRARARGRGDGRGLDRVPGWFPRWGARPAVRRPVRALARARAVLGGLACGFGKGRDGRMRQTNGGKGRGGRAGRARGLGRDAHLEHRNTDGEPHAAHAAPPALILALGRTRTSRRGGSIREWAHRRGRVARRRHHARGKPRGGHETATRVRAASWTRRAREIQTTAGARGVARAARYEPLGRDEADQTKMTTRVTRAGVVLASILFGARATDRRRSKAPVGVTLRSSRYTTRAVTRDRVVLLGYPSRRVLREETRDERLSARAAPLQRRARKRTEKIFADFRTRPTRASPEWRDQLSRGDATHLRTLTRRRW